VPDYLIVSRGFGWQPLPTTVTLTRDMLELLGVEYAETHCAVRRVAVTGRLVRCEASEDAACAVLSRRSTLYFCSNDAISPLLIDGHGPR
jgi:hypothetical protein